MFSITMMASSTTMPITSDRPRSVKVFSVNPKKYKTRNEPMSEVGIARMTLMAELQEPKNSQHTMEVRMTDIVSVKRSSFVESSINFVLSKQTFIFIFSGSMPERLN